MDQPFLQAGHSGSTQPSTPDHSSENNLFKFAHPFLTQRDSTEGMESDSNVGEASLNRDTLWTSKHADTVVSKRLLCNAFYLQDLKIFI